MKKYMYIFSIFSLVGSFVGVAAGNRNDTFHPQRLFTARAVTARLVFHTILSKDEDAKRCIKHSDFYAKKLDRAAGVFNKDNAIDYCLYPIVDNTVGRGMNAINSIESIHALTNLNISEDNKKFLANNTQLITSAAIVRLIRIESEKGIQNISGRDIKNFGKSCAVQVGCDVVDEFVIKPAVESLVEDQNSWTAWGMRGLGNYVLASIVINNVSKY